MPQFQYILCDNTSNSKRSGVISWIVPKLDNGILTADAN
jgi:hypothetical protein